MTTRAMVLGLALAMLSGALGACGGSARDGGGSDAGADARDDVLLADVTFDAAHLSDVASAESDDARADRDGLVDGLETGPDALPPDASLDASPEAGGDADDVAAEADAGKDADAGPDAEVVGGCATPFDTAACADAGPAGGTCLPDGAGHLACVAAGAAELGEPCGPDADGTACAPGLVCAGLAGRSLGEGGGACATPCHRADPACPAPAWCRGAFPDASELGVCFARACTPFEPGSCGAADLACLPAADGTGTCQPAGAKGSGEACGTGVGLCADGLTCLLEGPAGGRCVPFCDPGAGAGEPAACPGAELACVDLGIPAFGLCLAACDPWGVPTCPGAQACAPTGPGTGACYAVGTAAVGAPCAKAGAWWACAPGGLCAAPAADAQASCERTCRPFGPATDCPDPGAFCALRKTWLGTCATGALSLDVGAPCAPSGAWCGPNVRCTDLGAGPTCLAYCRVGTAGDCPGGTTCSQTYGVDKLLGICL